MTTPKDSQLIPPHGGYRNLKSYQAFLRQNGLRIWAQDSPEALEVRKKYLSGSQKQGIGQKRRI